MDGKNRPLITRAHSLPLWHSHSLKHNDRTYTSGGVSGKPGSSTLGKATLLNSLPPLSKRFNRFLSGYICSVPLTANVSKQYSASLPRAHESRKQPPLFFYPDTEQQGARLLMTLYGSVGVQRRASHSHGSRPASQLGKLTSSTVRHLLLKCFLTDRWVCLPFLNVDLVEKGGRKKNRLRVDLSLKKMTLNDKASTESLRSPPSARASPTQLWRSNILQHTALLCL